MSGGSGIFVGSVIVPDQRKRDKKLRRAGVGPRSNSEAGCLYKKNPLPKYGVDNNNNKYGNHNPNSLRLS